MVKAIVGANWGDEGKGKITDMLAETSDVVIGSRAVPMPATPSSMIMAVLLCTFSPPAPSTPTSPISSATVWHWTSASWWMS